MYIIRETEHIKREGFADFNHRASRKDIQLIAHEIQSEKLDSGEWKEQSDVRINSTEITINNDLKVSRSSETEIIEGIEFYPLKVDWDNGVPAYDFIKSSKLKDMIPSWEDATKEQIGELYTYGLIQLQVEGFLLLWLRDQQEVN